jgi:lipoprotein-anchoring transpeptidase ErfK/SrfK
MIGFLLGVGPAMADIAVPPDPVDGAYGVLERLGLLDKDASAPPAAVPAPVPASAPVSAATPAPAPQESAEAHAVLQRLGLLPAQERTAPASAAAVSATPHRPRSCTGSCRARGGIRRTPAPAASSARSRFAAGAVGMLERLGMVYKAPPRAPASDAATASATAAAPAPVTASGTAIAETEVRKDSVASATTVAAGSAVTTQTVTPPPEPPSYQVLRRLGLLKPLPGAAAGPLAGAGPRVDRVVVEKSKRKLYLVRNGEKFREYPILLGAMPRGPKTQAGDLRTPEGVYTLDWRNPKSRFYKAMHISYPSPSDRERAQEKGVDPGGMVMIHGEHYEPAMRRVLRRNPKDWTEGCIALNNEHIDELWHTVPVGTPIEIKP